MTIGQELVAFIRAEQARGVKRIHIGVRWCCRCRVEPRDIPGQRYCLECRKDYRKEHKAERKNKSQLSVLFHCDAFQAGLQTLRDGDGRRRRRRKE